MKTTENYLAEIKEIRKIMEESSRFLSLSGLSGVLVGIYAIIGAYLAYKIIYTPALPNYAENTTVDKLIILALVVIAFAFITVISLTYRRAKKAGKNVWNKGSRLMLLNLAIPLISGGALILIFVFRGIYSIISPACLVFYGLAIVNAAKFTRQELFYMGLLQVLLGIFAALFPSFGLIFWTLGFGVVHIIYGTIMYFRYEHKLKA